MTRPRRPCIEIGPVQPRSQGATPFGLRRAARVLDEGGVLAYPTEAVFGLGCDPLNPVAVHRLLALKRRPASKGLILIAADLSQLVPFVDLDTLPAARLAEVQGSWPGPHTWLLPTRAGIPSWLTGVHSSIAVRVTAHPLAAALCTLWGGALVSTSANRAGQRPARTALQVRQRLPRGVDLILHGPCGGAARPTSIRDAVTGVAIRD